MISTTSSTLNPVEIAQVAVNEAANPAPNGSVKADETKADAVDVDTVVNKTFESYHAEKSAGIASTTVSSSALSESAPATSPSPAISLSASASTSSSVSALPVPTDSPIIVSTSSNSALLTMIYAATTSFSQPQSLSRSSVDDRSVTEEDPLDISWYTALFLSSIQFVMYLLPNSSESTKASKSLSLMEYDSGQIGEAVREIEKQFSIELAHTQTASEVCISKRDYLLVSLWKRYQYYKQSKPSESPNEQLHLSMEQDLPLLHNLFEQILERRGIKPTQKRLSLEDKIIQQIGYIPQYTLKLIADNRISYEEIGGEITQLTSLLSCLQQFNSFENICGNVENQLSDIFQELMRLLTESRHLVASYVSKVALHMPSSTPLSFPLMQKYLFSLKHTLTARGKKTVSSLSSSSNPSQLSMPSKPINTSSSPSPSWLLNLFFSSPQESKESHSQSSTTLTSVPTSQTTSHSMPTLSTATITPSTSRPQTSQIHSHQHLFLNFLAHFIAVYQGNNSVNQLDSLVSESKAIPSNNSSSISFYLFIKFCFSIGWPENLAKNEQMDPAVMSQVVKKVKPIAQEDRTKAAYLKLILLQASQTVNIVDPKDLNTVQLTAKDKALALKQEELIKANWNTYKPLVAEIKKKLSASTQKPSPS